MKVDLLSLDGSKKSAEFSDFLFNQEEDLNLITRAAIYCMAQRRGIGCHKTKQRSEVNRTNRKPYRQKGTGNARQGDYKAPQFRGGGIVFGPHIRDHSIKMPKKLRFKALLSALSSKYKSNEIIFLDKMSSEEPKTKKALEKFKKIGINSSALLVDSGIEDNFAKSIRNIDYITFLDVRGINVYDIIKHEKLVITENAVKAIQERLNG